MISSGTRVLFFDQSFDVGFLAKSNIKLRFSKNPEETIEMKTDH